jgi:hypothetical protein
MVYFFARIGAALGRMVEDVKRKMAGLGCGLGERPGSAIKASGPPVSPPIKNGGTLEKAAAMANHTSTPAT